jgi:LAGLIDADG endonuclease/Proton-conducting membrane transporter
VKSAMNAMFTNRVGDFFLTIGFFAIFYAFGTLDYGTVFALSSYLNVDIITFIIILLLLGAAAKSAQIGLIKAFKIRKVLILNFLLTLKYAGKKMFSVLYKEKQDIYQQGLNNINENSKKTYNSEFLFWFIGFTEGDGSFYITGGKSIFSIHLHIADLNLLYEIQSQLKMGVVFLHEKSNSAYFMVKAKKDIKLLIEIFNGNLFLRKKQVQFSNWVINYNKKYKLNISIKTNKFIPGLNDNWLVGFIDAEGCFMVSVVRKKIFQRIVIGQKHAELEFVHLSKLINGYTEVLKKNDRIVVNYLKLDTIIQYLNVHKLRSIKAKSFEKWMEIYYFRKSKKHLTLIDVEIIKNKAKLINQLRKI